MSEIRGKREVDIPTVIGIAALTDVLTTQLHEAVGHGGVCLATGNRLAEWGAFYVQCETGDAPLWDGRLVAAAGSTVNLLVALFCLFMLKRTDAARPRSRFFWWLMGAANAMTWAGYYLFSGVGGVGDWSGEGVFAGVPAEPAWRVALALVGAVAYAGVTRFFMNELAGMTGRDEAGRRRAYRVSLTAYLSIGAVAVGVGLLNPVGLFVLVASAVASSLGGHSGLAWGPRSIPPGAAAGPLLIPRSWAWIGAGVAAVFAEAIILGPSLRF